MSDRTEVAKRDIAFLRELVEDSAPTMALDGAILAAVGAIFGCVSVFYWLLSADVFAMPAAWTPWAWIVGVLVLVPVMRLLQRRFPPSSGPASRAMLTAWRGVGTGILVAALAFGLGAWRLQLPLLVSWVFPVVLFTLYGTAWSVAFSVMRRRWFACVAGGCLAAALTCGYFMGQPEEWLVLSSGLFLFVAAPGVAILRQARSA